MTPGTSTTPGRPSTPAAPYGIDGAFWDRARTMAVELQTLIRTGGPEDTVRDAAEALRALLRPYI